MANKNTSNRFTFNWAGGNIFLIGFMGSGKTHWGKIWAFANQLSFVDLDDVIESKAGQPIAGIFESSGEDYFRKLEAEALRDCATLSNTIIACGGGTPCFFENIQWMNDHGVTVYLMSTPGEIFKRIAGEQEKRPLLKKLDDAALLFFIEQKIMEREPFYNQAKVRVQSNQLTENALPDIISRIAF